MAEFKRVISYIHLYENMKKGKNIGFVKTDVLDGVCRAEVRLNGVYTNGKEICEIYSLKKDGRGYFVGDFPMEHQMGECRIRQDENRIDVQGNSIHELEGFAFKLSEDRLALSFFSKKEPSFEEVSIAGRVYGRSGVSDVPDTLEVQSSPENEPSEEEAAPEPIPFAALQEEVLSSASLREEVSPPAVSDEKDSREEPESEEAKQSVPVITPFEDVTKYVFYKISPEHLVNLAPEYEIMQHNSFLLHGYYNYQYLIIGQKEDDRWILGVPGVYHDREQMMASMFGFPEFKGARKGKVISGTFGYYLKEVKVDVSSWELSPHPEETQKACI